MSNSLHDTTPLTKKLRFRGETHFHNRIEELKFEDESRRRNTATTNSNQNNSNDEDEKEKDDAPSFMDFFKVEMTRGYMLEHDEERYSARRQKIYAFVRIPRELERFMVYGIMQCADSFLYIHTFLPIRFLLAIWSLLTRSIAMCFRRRRTQRLLTPAEICDILKGGIWISCTLLMIAIDTNYVYHIIKSQSIIKLYIFYNMLEVGDRLLSAFGQDTIDALFWTATEPKRDKREHFNLLTHIIFVFFYVVVHSFLIMFQAVTLNVALNSNNKSLLTIMISNNFVELKGSVFKKFDKNNLFQLTCSDVRERFHLTVLLFIVTIQTMKEFDWSLNQFHVMLIDAATVVFTEIIIDWIKHAFITRFNELSESIYREYTTSLAYDMTQTRQKHAFSDHSDLVARRMGFIPFPLGVVLIKAIYSAVNFDTLGAWLIFLLTFLFALGLRICLTICALGKACKLMKEHQEEKSNSTPSSMTNIQPIGVSSNSSSNVHGSSSASMAQTRIETATSPTRPGGSGVGGFNLQQRATQSAHLETTYGTTNMTTSTPRTLKNNSTTAATTISSSTTNTTTTATTTNPNDVELDVKHSLELGATALFSNSDVDLDDVHLNEKMLDTTNNLNINSTTNFVDEELARSEPELFQQQSSLDDDRKSNESIENCHHVNSMQQVARPRPRTHKRSESEPSMQSIVGDCENQA